MKEKWNSRQPSAAEGAKVRGSNPVTPRCQPHLTCDVTAVIHCSPHIFLGLITAFSRLPAPVRELPSSMTGVAEGAAPAPPTPPVLPGNCV